MRRCRFTAALALVIGLRGAYCEDAAPAATDPKENSVKHSERSGHRHTNALAKETSPYLLQHAHNPVNWYAWGEEAFEKARKEEKPIFLSVGYSSCHWCHVMERESFENEDVAKILNEYFVSIKVDREERPDVDEIYMTVVQIYSQNGGWPMTVFMTPETKPFFGGTYFPPEDRFGRIGFKRLLKSVADLWKDRRKDVMADSERLAQAVHDMLAQRRVPKEGELDITLLKDCVDHLSQNLDPTHGGFGTRPKFPPNNGLPLLLELQEANLPETTKAVAKAKKITTLTLDQMALGGIHDQIAGGFHRYSTDDHWLVPHFEKMLYDNALLSKSYAVAAKLYANPEYERVARDIYDWVLREMTSPEGGFYSSLDADSEGEEGKFYVWDKKEIDSLLGTDSELFCTVFNINAAGNFKEEASGHDTGLNIPHLSKTLAEQAAGLKLSESDLRKKIDECKAKLLAVRIKRVWPGLDDKILTSWNGLMIASLARGSRVLNEPRYRDAAVKAADFLLKNLRKPDGRWLATHRKGQSKLPAYLDDHAFMAVAFLELFDATKDERWKNEAVKIIDVMDKHFADKERGGYFFTADDHEKLLARTKDPVDKAIPSGNGWSSIALVRLAALTGDKTYTQKALRIFEEFQGLMERAPQATESVLEGFAFYLQSNKTPDMEKPETITAAPSATKGPVSVELLSSQSALNRGASVPIAVRFKIDKGWHIQVEAPGDEPSIGVGFSLKSRNLGDLDTPVFPEPTKLQAPELGGDLKVHSGTVIGGALLNVGADAPLGQHALAVKVHFQACNDRSCEKPEEVLLSLPIEVVDENAKVKSINKDVFEKLKLDGGK